MPQTLWENSGTSFRVVIRLRRPITSTDLPRLLFYSARVRSLDMQYPSWFGTLHHEFLRALGMSIPSQCFMPKLIHFTWSPKETESQILPIMHHFLGPRIRKIDLRFADDTAGLSILPYIKSSCPLVSEFCLDFRGEDTLSVCLISDAVCGWQHLTDLGIPNLDKAGFIHIAQLPSLKKLSLWSAKDTAFFHLPEFLSGPTFPSLKSLFVCCETARFCTGIVQVISSRQLERLVIRPLAIWTTSIWEQLHTILRDCLDNTSLESIEVEQGHGLGRPADSARYILSSDALRPLLAFKKLTCVIYQVYPGLDVDDDFLKEMALAWPAIETLQFGTQVLITQQPRVTLNCLIAFAEHCRSLVNLGVRMNATHVPEFTQEPGGRISNWLNCLEVGTSPITREAHVAAFLSNLFPELEFVFPFSHSELLPEPLDSYATSWSRVSAMVPVFCTVRSQEEEFWTEEVDDDVEKEEQAETVTVDSLPDVVGLSLP
ncbi:F-box domain-containing protein [Mycena venus]|uniref:F-box domain-containing protein n=1 Tax=Mycena venus TaxID=2733690 RepID=A0A8H6WYK8_9AGAR|nr:F-box domain-containing protein [Mycena venus]